MRKKFQLLGIDIDIGYLLYLIQMLCGYIVEEPNPETKQKINLI